MYNAYLRSVEESSRKIVKLVDDFHFSVFIILAWPFELQ